MVKPRVLRIVFDAICRDRHPYHDGRTGHHEHPPPNRHPWDSQVVSTPSDFFCPMIPATEADRPMDATDD